MKRFSHHILICVIFFSAVSLFSANLTVPLFELVTRGYMDDDIITLDTRGRIHFQFEGGYKFGGSIGLGLNSNALNGYNTQLDDSSEPEDIVMYLNSVPFLEFRSAEITIRNIFNIPVDMSYFTGYNSTFCNGDDFRSIFGTGHIGSRMRGYMYFMDGVIYDGIHQVYGTGIKLESGFGKDSVKSQLYTYQNGYIGQGYFTSEFRTLISMPSVKFEAYSGISYPVGPYGMYHGGILLQYSAGDIGSFLAQVGIPRYIPDIDDPGIDLFYFLFEPRVKFGPVSFIVTLFLHPDYYKEYLAIPTGESGTIDANFNILFGEPEISIASGGLESTITFKSEGDDQLITKVTPYFSMITEGVTWDFKLKTRVYPYALKSLFEVFVGIRAEF